MAKKCQYCTRAGQSKHGTRIKAARAVRLLESKPICGTAVELEHGTQLAKPVCVDCVKRWHLLSPRRPPRKALQCRQKQRRLPATIQQKPLDHVAIQTEQHEARCCFYPPTSCTIKHSKLVQYGKFLHSGRCLEAHTARAV